jgi:hypothetical protein
VPKAWSDTKSDSKAPHHNNNETVDDEENNELGPDQSLLQQEEAPIQSVQLQIPLLKHHTAPAYLVSPKKTNGTNQINRRY